MSERSLAWLTSNVKGREAGLTVFDANNGYMDSVVSNIVIITSAKPSLERLG